MTKVIVRAPGKVSRRIAGVTFSEGRAEVDTDSAAFQFFKRRGYKIKPLRAREPDEPPRERNVAPTGEHDASQRGPEGNAPESDELEDDARESDEPEDDERDDDELQSEEDEGNESGASPTGDVVERPHPVQGSKAVWFEYLTKIKPDHGFDLEQVSRKALIEAVEALEAK